MTHRLSESLWVWLWAWPPPELVGAKGTFITRRCAGLFGNPGNSISTISFIYYIYQYILKIDNPTYLFFVDTKNSLGILSFL